MKIPSLPSLLLASFTGKLIYALASIVSLPLAARTLGAEAVGLVGFFTTLLMVLMVLEGGLTSSVIQRLARLRVTANTGRAQRSSAALINTFLLVFVGVGLAITVILYLVSPLLVSHWLRLDMIANDDAVYCLRCMAMFIGLNLPVMLLQGVFVGNQLQGPLNKLYIPYSLMRTLGVLLLVGAGVSGGGVKSYFTLQVVVQAVYVVSLLVELYRQGGLAGGRLHSKYIKNGVVFSRGVFFISLTSIVTVQYDKVFMSGALGLSEYAYYSLASAIAGFPYIFSSAFNAVLFPRFSGDFRGGKVESIEKIFRAGLVLFALVMTIVCSAVYWFASPLLNMLFSDFLAAGISRVLPWLLIGTALQSLLIIPFALQMAAGWTSLSFRLNLAAIPVMLISLPYLVKTFGAVGGGYGWLLYNLFSLVLTTYFTSRRYPWLLPAYRVCLTAILVVGLIANCLFLICSHWAESTPATLASGSIASGLLAALGAYIFRRHLAGLR